MSKCRDQFRLKLIKFNWTLSIVADCHVISNIIIINKLHIIKEVNNAATALKKNCRRLKEDKKKKDEHQSKKVFTYLINKLKDRFKRY